MLVTSTGTSAAPIRNGKAEIRVYNDFSLPLEPATLYSMSEYNLSLCLFSTLFELDESSVPMSNILSSWEFSAAGHFYEFTIKNGIFWSDGRPFTAVDIKTSITRLKVVAPTHYHSIASLAIGKSLEDVDSGFEIVSDRVLRVHVRGPTPDLFARLTTSFIPMVRQDLLDSNTLQIAHHNITLAPYILDESLSDKDHLMLVKNQRYFKIAPTMADSIEMRPYLDHAPRAEDILKQDSWPNIILDRAFTTKSGWDAIKKAGVPVWTRPVDRVLYLYPTKHGMEKAETSQVMSWFGSTLANNPITFEEFPGVQSARSLQPKGFFLHEDIKFNPGKAPAKGLVYHVAMANLQIPAEYIQEQFKSRGLEITYEPIPVSKAKEVRESRRFDLVIMSVGAADPDPVTWLSLILGNELEFIADYDHVYRKKFERIKSDPNATERVAKLRELLNQAGKNGLYVPLAHFSSIAVADASLDLKLIRQSDETIDLSKVIVKNRSH